MIAGSTLRTTCFLLGCLALSLFAAEVIFGQSFGLPLLYRFRKPLNWQTESEQSVPEFSVETSSTIESTQPLETSQPTEPSTIPSLPDVALVVASQSSDNTDWLKHVFPDWTKHIYVTDDRWALLTVPKNKGREGMVYLTYIIDNYDHLPDIALFRHAERYQWHSDDPLFDGERLLSRIQIPYIQQRGYTNLRCGWILTCPASVRPHDDASDVDPGSDGATAQSFYKKSFEILFPGQDVPEEVGGPCCAQFAVTRDRIRQRPKSDYERIRTWLMETPLNDDLSGRVMEYSWHIVFGEPAVSCPPASQCYCGLYGLCNLECEEEGDCTEQYTMPTYSTLPDGWPDIDWDAQWRNITEMRLDYDQKHPISDGVEGLHFSS